MMTKLVPKLRFKEFSGEWEEDILGKVVKFLDGKRKPIKESDRASMQGEYPYYGASGIIDYVNDYIFDEDLILLGEDGENIVSRNLPLVFKVSGKSWVNNHAHVLKPLKEHKLDFLVQYLENLSYAKYNSGGAQPKLNQAVCKTIPLIIPKPKEQQKIASTFLSLDNLIEATKQKVEALQKHKKGLMQQLFPSDGEKVPKLRFKEFSGEWEEKKLGDIFTIFQGHAFSSHDSRDTGTRWVKIADVGIQKMDTKSASYLPIEYKNKYEKYLLKNGDYVIALTRPILNKKLKIAPINKTYHNSLLNQRVGKIITSQNKTFVYYFLQTQELINSIERNIAGNEPPNLSMKQINKIKIYIPTPIEQQKIASTLSSLDNLIEATKQKVEALQKHKKGLMQQMFVSGEG